jgi:hydroxyethylthiazole kinase
VNINIGTLKQIHHSAMFAAGAKANSCGHPFILDPVGTVPHG